jgi:vacuolar protein sorting-associated protein 45
VDTLADMQRFVMEHSDFQRAQSSAAKHVNVVAELSAAVSERALLEVSSAEQELANPAATLTAATAYDESMRLIRNLAVRDSDKVRLVMLYALRFEADTLRVRSLADYLVTAGVRDREPRLYAAIGAVLQYAGGERRAGDLYGSRNLLHKAKNLVRGLQGVDNVYTQHTPLLSETVQQLGRGELPPGSYPFMGGAEEALAWQALARKAPPREAVVFVLGGTTYEEAKCMAEWNEKHPELRVVLGGSGVLNSAAFLEGLTAGCELGGGEQGLRLNIQ